MFYTPAMTKNASIPVRLDSDLEKRVESLCERLRLSKSAIIRMLLEEFVAHYERHGGRIVMPPGFKDYDIRERNGDKRHPAP